MWFVYLFIWNFIIGGVTGIYLSDVPADQFFHGDMFVTAHFHYTLLGGAMIGRRRPSATGSRRCPDGCSTNGSARWRSG